MSEGLIDPNVCECGHVGWRHDPDVGCMLESYDFMTMVFTMCDCFTFIRKEIIPNDQSR